MNFRTKFNISPSKEKISYSDRLFFIGSCFSNNIGKSLKKRKFSILSNPFGILYNPISVFENLESIANQKTFTEKDLFLKDEIWNCFSFHSDLSGTNKESVLKNINNSIATSHTFLAKTNSLFITMGTAWVYEINNKIVANCFKVASQKFIKRLLTVEEIYAKAVKLIQQLNLINSDLKIVFTVSPVRHLKDGFIENNQSKATLILAIQKINQNFNKTSYFPAYEFLMDDLRDYRFYTEDMVHPNTLAIKYILKQFDAYYFSEETKNLIQKIEKINISLNHKVRFKETLANQKFEKSLHFKIQEMENLGFDFSKERNLLPKD